MGLQLKATRRASLAGFATGWDDCYFTVDVVRAEEAEAYADKVEKLKENSDLAGLNELVKSFLLEHTQGGLIINTAEDGTAAPYEFSKEEAAQVIEFIGFSWQLDLLGVATGSDRLKGKSY